MHFESILRVSKKPLGSANYSSTEYRSEEFEMLLCFLFLFKALLGQKFCLLSPILYILIYVEIYFTYFSCISDMARYTYFQMLDLFSSASVWHTGT